MALFDEDTTGMGMRRKRKRDSRGSESTCKIEEKGNTK